MSVSCECCKSTELVQVGIKKDIQSKKEVFSGLRIFPKTVVLRAGFCSQEWQEKSPEAVLRKNVRR